MNFTSMIFIWQRFCELARIRIAYGLCFCVCLSCLTSHTNRAYSLDLGSREGKNVFQFLLAFAHNILFCLFMCTPLPDTLSAEDRSYWICPFQPLWFKAGSYSSADCCTLFLPLSSTILAARVSTSFPLGICWSTQSKTMLIGWVAW